MEVEPTRGLWIWTLEVVSRRSPQGPGDRCIHERQLGRRVFVLYFAFRGHAMIVTSCLSCVSSTLRTRHGAVDDSGCSGCRILPRALPTAHRPLLLDPKWWRDCAVDGSGFDREHAKHTKKTEDVVRKLPQCCWRARLRAGLRVARAVEPEPPGGGVTGSAYR